MNEGMHPSFGVRCDVVERAQTDRKESDKVAAAAKMI